jgi:MYXO-CTERM domain-containing protein
MISKRFAIIIAVTVLLLVLIPACALAAGGSISGKVAIPRNATIPEYINTTVVDNVTYRDITQKINVVNLTVFAYNTKTGFSNVTFPNQDGSYSVQVSENGVYRIYILPSEVLDLVNPSNWTYVYYPNQNDRIYTVDVYGDVNNADINYYPPGQYVTTNIKANATPVPGTSATPAPGFAALLVLAGLLGAFAIVRRNK